MIYEDLKIIHSQSVGGSYFVVRLYRSCPALGNPTIAKLKVPSDKRIRKNLCIALWDLRKRRWEIVNAIRSVEK